MKGKKKGSTGLTGPLGSSGATDQSGLAQDSMNTQGPAHEAVPFNEHPADPLGWLDKTVGGKK